MRDVPTSANLSLHMALPFDKLERHPSPFDKQDQIFDVLVDSCTQHDDVRVRLIELGMRFQSLFDEKRRMIAAEKMGLE